MHELRIRSESESDSDLLYDTAVSDSEDDIPLAKRIPGALQAQKSIRFKDKAERDRKRMERRALKQTQRPVAIEELTKKLQASLPSNTLKQTQRPFAVEELTKKLQASSPPSETLRRPAHTRDSSPQPRHVDAMPRPRKQSISHSLPQPASPSRPPIRGPASPALSQQLSRNPSTAHRQGPSIASAPGSPRSHDVPEQRDVTVVRARTVSSSARAPKHVLQRARTAGVPVAPHMPALPQEVRQTLDTNFIQHRVFVGDMQRFNTVKIGSQTQARDVIDVVEAQGELRGLASIQPGGWMLWEIAQEFGMERPLRDYELPAEVYASWNNNARLNSFMIKKTPLAPLLARKAMPSSSPTYSGYVQWESKRGKWNKRWMELREHSLWLSKRDNGKDSTFLCSLSNFDCYYVTRSHRAPKPFVFALKSTDNLTLFENPADYLHIFACDHNDGQRWVERVLLARSYVLYKERTVLFSAAPAGFPIQNTYKAASSSRPAAPLVDVNTLQAPAGQPAIKSPFQSGSLLAKASV